MKKPSHKTIRHGCKHFLVIFAALLLCTAMSLQAQKTTITGVVKDEQTGELLFSVNVVVKGTTIGAVTDFDGKFTLNVDQAPPFDVVASFIGYDNFETTITESNPTLKIDLVPSSELLEMVTVKDRRVSEKQKEAPLTVETLDIIAIKETPAANFYDGLGALKGVDLTAASIGFKIINTRGFNSTSPVRSLQLIDGVDNQSPGLNFSLGNFLGSSELDVQKVEIIAGASTALFGPSAFNGVIDMRTKDPFIHQGLSFMVKGGERNLLESNIRYAKAWNNKFAFKVNASWMQADDWEAVNYDPTDQSETGIGNPGRYDAVNVYGDETAFFASGSNQQVTYPGLGDFYRNGYREIDLVDYDSRNLKLAAALHYKIRPNLELIYASSYATGTTVYQGQNRFSLKGIQFYQNRLEIRDKDRFFIRAYATNENAGETYDAVLTAFLMQQRSKDNNTWQKDYRNYWVSEIVPQVEALEGYPEYEFNIFDPQPFPEEEAQAALALHADQIAEWHEETLNYANNEGLIPGTQAFLVPGTPEFEAAFNEITTSKVDVNQGGSLFFDRSALYHAHGEYKFKPDWANITVGANVRQYRPQTEGTIFSDTAGVVIVNSEFGMYGAVEKRMAEDKLILTGTLRADKNQNFDLLLSPAASAVYKLGENNQNILRLSLSSAIRNPTLADQYLYYNVGPAILLGNLDGYEGFARDAEGFGKGFVNVDSLISFFDTQRPESLDAGSLTVQPVRPEQVRSVEIGYKGSISNSVFVDASYYFSRYKDFIGFNLGVDLEHNPNINQVQNLQAYRLAANARDVVFTQGFSIGLNYYFGNYFAVNGNYSWNALDLQGSDDPIIPAFNTPEHKFNIGLSARDMEITLGDTRLRHIGFNVNYKWVDGFVFEGSPQFTGFVNSYDMLDGQVNYKVPRIHTTFKLGASNILNNKVYQAYGGPAVGRLAYFSALVELKPNN
ncbi:MAG: TonB-dependent receptor [Chitinophagales bacterium]